MFLNYTTQKSHLSTRLGKLLSRQRAVTPTVNVCIDLCSALFTNKLGGFKGKFPYHKLLLRLFVLLAYCNFFFFTLGSRKKKKKEIHFWWRASQRSDAKLRTPFLQQQHWALSWVCADIGKGFSFQKARNRIHLRWSIAKFRCGDWCVYVFVKILDFLSWTVINN